VADDYYAILGVEKDATSQDIKRAFRQIARECHPDRSGGDPAAEERFKKSRQAYETLMDPVTRARYDRRGQRRFRAGESFFDAFYRHTGGGGGEAPSHGKVKAKPGANASGRRRRKHDPGNDVSLDDLFNDFGFGGGRVDPGARKEKGPEHRGQPTPGADVHVDLEVPSHVARTGGSVTAVYYRMQRADSWRPGMGDPGLVRVQDIADVRIIPGTRTGEVLREKGLGNAGAHGGPYGDLVARVRVIAAQRAAADRGAAGPRTEPGPGHHRGTDGSAAGGGFSGGGPFGGGASSGSDRRSSGGVGGGAERAGASGPSSGHASADMGPEASERHETTLDITVVEALLGGRVPLDTPQGPVRLSIPPGSSGGSKLRLRGKGPRGTRGEPTDLYVCLRVVVPSNLDADSRRLIEEFARLNPDLAR